MNANVTLEFTVRLEHLAAVRAQIRPTAAVHASLMSLHVARNTETLVTQRTDVCPLSGVHSHMHREMGGLSERLVAHEAPVWLLFTVNSVVSDELV